ncbi:alpha-mannosidase [uncultured Enterococcus sp.]|uniref:alpha-mannosidase n=1 Tax=uncultured Enterococcus sp. TaxID=167972 RepID=UPI0025F3A0A4|nr:alpha-mannosidase [uncultured Enterococcus sp.]
MKKKVYIVSHSHWDREWYLPYEEHHMRLIELMDDLLELFDTDPDFHSFHLDGQTIILDDYLQVRPENEAKVREAIAKGKLQIGPFYILQDDFLISSESNVRNMLIGHAECERYGQSVPLGYFPDTFGNMGQTPQLMQLANLETAAFGRGVKPIGFDNEVLADESYTSQFSEMHWEGPDGSKILGILFANWYSNGNEIPVNEEDARLFWDQKLAEVERFASTDHLLMMNGVDHQPVQKDVTKAIALANDLYPEYEFVHASFKEYIEAVTNDLPESLSTVTGELTSQETDGWFTLANTASARVYLKQWNTKVSRLLENVVEPLATMAYERTGSYPHDQIDYAWKLLMQNHPHDSICGCSVDEVHREMVTRFEKAEAVGQYLVNEALDTLKLAIDTSMFTKPSHPFVVWNTSNAIKQEVLSVEVELERILFKEAYPSIGYDQLAERVAKEYHVVDQNGKEIPAIISEEKIRFGYDLPKDRFRVPYMQKYVTVSFALESLAAFSWQTFALVEGKAQLKEQSFVQCEGRVLENEYLKIVIQENGALTVTDKQLEYTLTDQLIFEDVGDIANEYIFRQPENDQPYLSTDFEHQIEVLEDTPLQAKIKLTHLMELPISADEQLEIEQIKIVDFRERKAQRSTTKTLYPIETIITFHGQSKQLQVETKVDNTIKDHRLRVLFDTKIVADQHEADSIYETVVRPNQVSPQWENPTNPQHQHAFVNLHDEKRGVTVVNYGLNEYEIVDSTIALTLVRGVGELGDWGYFETPEAQCLGVQTFCYGMMMHGELQSRYETYTFAHTAQVPLQVVQTNASGDWQAAGSYLSIDQPLLEVTAVKRRRNDQALIVRGYNLSDQAVAYTIETQTTKLEQSLNVLEQPIECSPLLQPYQIITKTDHSVCNEE